MKRTNRLLYSAVFLAGIIVGVLALSFLQSLGFSLESVDIFGVRVRPPSTATHALVLTTPPQPSDLTTQSVLLRHLCDADVTAIAEQPLNIYYGVWAARGVENARSNASTLQVELLLDGETVHGDIQEIRSDLPVTCGRDYVDSYWVYYLFSMPEGLTVGEHQARVTLSARKQLCDGYDNNNNSTPDCFGPGVIDDRTYRITALAP